MKQITYTIGQGLDRNGKPLSSLPERRREALTELAHEFGGYTASLGNGGWIDRPGELIEEPSLTVTILTDKPEVAIQTEARYLAAEFDQTAVMVAESPATVQYIEQTPVSAPIAPVSFPAGRETLRDIPIDYMATIA